MHTLKTTLVASLLLCLGTITVWAQNPADKLLPFKATVGSGPNRKPYEFWEHVSNTTITVYRPKDTLYMDTDPYKGVPFPYFGASLTDSTDTYNTAVLRAFCLSMFSEKRKQELKGKRLTVMFCVDTTGYAREIQFLGSANFPATLEELDRIDRGIRTLKLQFSTLYRKYGAIFERTGVTVLF